MNEVYSISEITYKIKYLLSLDPELKNVRLKGEISNYTRNRSGHIYFTLKDENCQISCVMFKSDAYSLRFAPCDGQSVIITGRIDVYGAQGKYQVYVTNIEPDGQGSLLEAYERLKLKLEQEGLFDPAHKLPIPAFAQTIGIITSQTGDVINDIQTVAYRRNPYVKLILYPAHVQGIEAEAEIIRGIHKFEELKPDLIIIARGGGSMEDLWIFNSEAIAHAVYNCTVPIISGVGHEPDVTIIDYVADRRAATPSAAAELAVFEYSRIQSELIDLHSRLYHGMSAHIERERSRVERYQLRLNSLSPNEKLRNLKLKVDKISDRIQSSFERKLSNSKHRLQLISEGLNNLSPLKSLVRGYSYLTDTNGHNIKSVKGLKPSDRIRLTLTDGTLDATINNITEESSGN